MKGLRSIIAIVTALTLFPHAAACKERIRTVKLAGVNTVMLLGKIEITSVDTVSSAIIGKRSLLNPSETLYVVIVSEGGFYENSLRLKELLATMPNTSLICKYCASAAGMLFATFKGQRLAIDKSELIMHEMYIDHVTASMVKNIKELTDLVIMSDEFNQSMVNIIGMPKSEYEKKILKAEWSVKGKELVKLNLASELVEVECDNYVKLLLPNTCSK